MIRQSMRFTVFALLLFTLAGCGKTDPVSASLPASAESDAGNETESAALKQTDSTEVLSEPIAEPSADDASSDSGDSIASSEIQTLSFGDQVLTVGSAEFLTDYYGEEGVSIAFTFTNYSSEFACVNNTFRLSAYQDDLRLKEETYFDHGTDMANLNAEIKDGRSVDCKVVFRPLTTDPVTFTVRNADGEEQSVQVTVAFGKFAGHREE